MAPSSKHDLDNILLSQIPQQMPGTTTISGTSTIEQLHGIYGPQLDPAAKRATKSISVIAKGAWYKINFSG